MSDPILGPLMFLKTVLDDRAQKKAREQQELAMAKADRRADMAADQAAHGRTEAGRQATQKGRFSGRGEATPGRSSLYV